MNVFAITKDKENPLRRIPVTGRLQTQLDGLFREQAKTLTDPQLERVEFNGEYHADEDEVLYIDSFALPKIAVDALTTPLSVDELKLDSSVLPTIKGVICGEALDGGLRVYAQSFENRRLLTKTRLSLLYSSGTYSRLDGEVLTLDTQLAAVVEKTRIYFNSFAQARRIFDLGEFFREATNEDLEKFAAQPRAAFENSQQFIQSADIWVRRKVALLMEDAAILEISPKDMKKAAKSLGVELRFAKKDGQDAVFFPADKKHLKELLRFLDEDLYVGMLSHRRLCSNSKREYT